ncbi:uncharacterized protein BO72DRAFT_491044 [Aspergillus fijiensis CBS 313.89]|uniref:Uncharacterized protein n=1 Tax=Aspergillus fijiensis CBS 313.89 TaxID=1448319 RepID=A0A8G1S332_9EURO|nr:uncharacterized protein BO72DRAFT_491044 [Aspergillus fijiensis CBS 313.89]RAK82555.1 hypothetical protein BO72DRAFT_491044 [Aspergillus fijiensis CBS 313.89]
MFNAQQGVPAWPQSNTKKNPTSAIIKLSRPESMAELKIADWISRFGEIMRDDDDGDDGGGGGGGGGC